jgi:hypothetical protein
VDRDPALGPRTVTLAAGSTVTRTLTQDVPGFAPAGTYAYALNVGSFPGGVLSTDAFTFVKQASPEAPPSGGPAGWTARGWDDAAGAPLAGAAAAGVGAYPNPFATATTIRFALEAPSAVRLAVYDVLGREVAVLVDGHVEAGAHAALLDGRGLAPGVYVVRMTTGTQTLTHRLTLAR